jgi:hypothetical protein
MRQQIDEKSICLPNSTSPHNTVRPGNAVTAGQSAPEADPCLLNRVRVVRNRRMSLNNHVGYQVDTRRSHSL